MNNTLLNGFKVLEYLAETAEPRSVKELAEIMEIPNSHACRLLKSLKEIGYVEQTGKKRQYRISLKILTLSNACLKQLVIRNRVRPYLDRIVRELNCPAFLSVPLNGRPLIIDVIYPAIFEDTGITIGGYNQIHSSATGKVCAAYCLDDELEALLDSCDFPKFTDSTITDRKLFKKELLKVKRDKVAVTDSEQGKGIAAVAAPVFNYEGELAGAVGTTLPREAQNEAGWTELSSL
jgi:DNA-binding IclR family transcriptional regulator